MLTTFNFVTICGNRLMLCLRLNSIFIERYYGPHQYEFVSLLLGKERVRKYLVHITCHADQECFAFCEMTYVHVWIKHFNLRTWQGIIFCAQIFIITIYQLMIPERFAMQMIPIRSLINLTSMDCKIMVARCHWMYWFDEYMSENQLL